MPWFQVDDSFYDDPAVSRAGTAAVGLYFRCGVYVARHLLDGHVPSEVAVQYGTPEWIKRLTDAGLWETEPGGHYMPRYLKVDKNPSRARVEEDRRLKSERQQRWLEKQRNSRSESRRVSRRSSRRSRDATRDGPEDKPLPPSLTGRKGSHARAARDGAGGDQQSPLLMPVETHSYSPDDNGTCGTCGLPETNARHLEAS
jgi:hypothetical protein